MSSPDEHSSLCFIKLYTENLFEDRYDILMNSNIKESCNCYTKHLMRYSMQHSISVNTIKFLSINSCLERCLLPKGEQILT
jgi:hypothetical protein